VAAACTVFPMAFPVLRPRSLFRREHARDDAVAGLVLGVESVPDGLASGLLAGVNPLAGLYGYLFGMVGATLFTSTAFMAVQGTGAMAIIIADVDLASRADPARTLFTLSIVTGVVMILAGVLHFGSFLRFVSNSVMTGFITAVGINIVLGQLDNFTGYSADGGNRVARAFDLLLNLGQIDLPTITIGAVTVVLIVVLQQTKLGALGLVVAIAFSSAVAAVFASFDRDVALVGDIASVPGTLPFITMPAFGEIPFLLIPAASLAFVGLVQGAGVAAAVPNEDGSPSDEAADFIGQGAGNLAAGLFQGMPVGGSMSASSLAATAGAKSRTSLLFAGATMAVVILLFNDLVELIAMPALAGLLMVVGVGTIKPSQVVSVAKTGAVPLTVMATTFALTLIIPLQYAVLVGVGMSVVLFVANQSTHLTTKRMVLLEDGRVEEVDPPDTVPADEVIVLQPYGAIFFASVPQLTQQMPTVVDTSRNSVVILRMRGADDAGSTMIDMLTTYAQRLRAVGSKLVVVTDNERVIRQLRVTGITEIIGAENIYQGTVFVGETVRRAHADARAWIAERSIDSDQV
jgi:sulfate permease, SulP family